MGAMPIPADGVTTTRGLLRDEVYARLCDAIVDGTFQPGEQLRDGEIAEWLGVSRTPVREAVLRLARTGLVVSIPGRSTVVAGVEPQTIQDAQDVVAMMHELAIRTAIPFIRPGDIEVMRRANRRFEVALAAGDAEAAERSQALRLGQCGQRLDGGGFVGQRFRVFRLHTSMIVELLKRNVTV